MWYARYNDVSLNGFENTLKAHVEYYNDVDATSFREVEFVSPENLDSSDFKVYIQKKVDSLNAKQAKIDTATKGLSQFTQFPIGLAPELKTIELVSSVIGV